MSMFQRMIEGDDPQAPGRDAFGMPQYPQDERTAALAARLMASRSPAQQARLQALQQATPETLPPPAPATLTPQQAALMAVGMLPGVGDVVGVGADAYTMATSPEARTPFNALLAAAGLLPFVPSGLGTVRRVLDDTTPVRRVAKKATTQAGRSANGAVAAGEMGADAGGGLPMDEASRMQRAREMGYTVDAYHGTPRTEEIDSFNLDPPKRFTPHPSNSVGVHAASSPDHAEFYALPTTEDGPDSGPVYPLKIRMQKPAKMSADEYFEATETPEKAAAFRKWAMNAGFDGVEVRHKPGFYDNPVEYVSFDPRNIRSRFAAFDPAKRDSSDLLASMAPVAAAGGAAALYALSPEDAAAMGMTPAEYEALMQYLSGQ